MIFWIIIIVALIFALIENRFANQKQKQLFAAIFFTAWICATAVFIYSGYDQGARYGIAASVGCATAYLKQAISEYRKKPEEDTEKDGSQ